MTQILQTAVIAYLHTLAPFSRKFQNLQDLRDGIIFAQLIFILTDKQVEGICNQPNNFSLVLSNLKCTVNSLERYHISLLKRNLNRQKFDIIQIAKNRNQNHIINLFLAFLGIAVQSSKRGYFIEKILTLGQQCQACFVDILRDVIADPKQQSPKREISIENKLLQKLQQLEAENEKLEKLIKQLTEQKQDLNNQIKSLHVKIEQFELENERLQQIIRQYSIIQNSKLRDSEKQKNQMLIDNLKKKLIQITKQHEIQKARLKEQYQMENYYAPRLQALQQQNDLYKQKQDQYKQALQKYDFIETNFKKHVKILQDRDDLIKRLKQKLTQTTSKLYDFEQKEIYSKIELEKKNTRIHQLNRQLQMLKYKEVSSNNIKLQSTKTLASMCSEVGQGELEQLKEQNETLIKELQRSSKRIRTIERELQKYKRQYQNIPKLQAQNKKLEQILFEYNQSRGQQNEILIGCLYELRIKYQQLEKQRHQQLIENVIKVQDPNILIVKKCIY